MDKETLYFMVAFLSIFLFIMICLTIFSLTDARTQEAENKVIIEQLCNLDKTSYWCKKIDYRR